MATKYNSIDDVDFSVAISGVPAGAGDTININKFATRFTAGLDISAHKAALITIHPQSKCEFMSPLVCQTAALVYNGSGNKFPVRSSSAAGVIDSMVISPARENVAVEISTCKLTNGLYVLGGIVTVRDDVDTAADVEIARGSLEIVYSATYLIDGVFRAMGGVSRLSRKAVAAQIGGSATVILEESRAVQGNFEQTGGTFVVADSGTIDQYIGRAGVIDFTRLSRPITITDWQEYPGLTVKVRKNGPTITKTSSAAPYGSANYEYV